MKGLKQFQHFDLHEFLNGKRVAYVKSTIWKDGEVEVGSRVVLQIMEDKTQYAQPGVDNFGEQFTVKVRGIAPSAFAQLRPFNTEVTIQDVERVTLYGDYSNNVSIIGKIAVKNAQAGK